MVLYCCVFECKSKAVAESREKFFRIPRIIRNQGKKTLDLSTKRRFQWMRSIGPRPQTGICSTKLSDAQIDLMRVCSKHFISGIPAKLYDETHPDWAPSLLVWPKLSKQQAILSKAKRYERRLKRHARPNEPSNIVGPIPRVDEEQVMQDIDVNTLNCERTGDKRLSNVDECTATDTVLTEQVTQTNTILIEQGTQTNEFLTEDDMQMEQDIILQKTPARPDLIHQGTQTKFRVSYTFELESAELRIENLKEKLKVSEEQTKNLINDLKELNSSLLETKKELEKHLLKQSFFKDQDAKVNFFTGLENYELLLVVYEEVKPYLFKPPKAKLTEFQQLILTLMKLRLGCTHLDLAYRFNVSDRTVGRTFYNCLNALYHRNCKNIFWPEREALQKTMPITFQEKFGKKVVVVIDCFEVFCDKSASLLAKAQTWSQYKHQNTVKFLIGISPQGTVTFISKGWGGRVTDTHITENCGILENLLPGDVLLADRGFDIEESVAFHYAEVKIPTKKGRKNQLAAKDVESTRDIVHVRIHVERVIGFLRQKFRILHIKMPIELLGCCDGEDLAAIDKIAVVCCALTNLSSPIIPFE